MNNQIMLLHNENHSFQKDLLQIKQEMIEIQLKSLNGPMMMGLNDSFGNSQLEKDVEKDDLPGVRSVIHEGYSYTDLPSFCQQDNAQLMPPIGFKRKWGSNRTRSKLQQH